MYVQQETKGDVLVKLRIEGSEEELRAFALSVLDAIDNGKASSTVADTLKIRIVKTG